MEIQRGVRWRVGLLVLTIALAPACIEVARTPAGSATASAQRAAASSPAASTSPVRSELGSRLGVIVLGETAADVQARLGRPDTVAITHGIGSAEWVYQGRYLVRFHGTTSAPRDVWQIIAYPGSGAKTDEGFAVGETEDRFLKIYAGWATRRFFPSPDPTTTDQVEVTGDRAVLLAGFDSSGAASWLNLRRAGS